MNKSSKINVNASSLVGLKAELFKKQEQLKRDRLQPGGSTSASSNRNRTGESKKPSIWSKKNAGVTGRAEKDLEQLADERNELDNARNKLESKAKFYEKMTKDGYIPDADSDERFLVDFEKKALDRREEFKHRVEELEKEEDIPPPANRDEEWVDYTDTLGRSRCCMRKDLPNLISMDKRLNPQVYDEQEKVEKKKDDLPDLMSNDMYREMLRKKWEAEEEEAAKGPLSSTHYQNVKYDEVRDMGVGYFDFSKDQTLRNQQMDTLQLLRDETVGQRERREKLKLKRKAAMKARLEKIKERKRLKGELVEDEEEEEEEEEEKEDERLTEAAEKEIKSSKESTVREWDIGKEPVSAWDQRLTNIRDERPAEFAPPSIYSDSCRKRGPNQTSRYPPPKDYNSPFSDRFKEKNVNKPSSAASSEFSPPDSYQEQSSETAHRSRMNLPAPKDYSSMYGKAKEETVNKPSGAGSCEFAPSSSYQEPSPEMVHRSKINLPPPRDYSSIYGRANEKTGQKSSTATFSHWNKPSGSSALNQPFTAAGGLDNSSRGGAGGRIGTGGMSTDTGGKGTGNDEDAIASALSFFRKNAGK